MSRYRHRFTAGEIACKVDSCEWVKRVFRNVRVIYTCHSHEIIFANRWNRMICSAKNKWDVGIVLRNYIMSWNMPMREYILIRTWIWIDRVSNEARNKARCYTSLIFIYLQYKTRLSFFYTYTFIQQEIFKFLSLIVIIYFEEMEICYVPQPFFFLFFLFSVVK